MTLDFLSRFGFSGDPFASTNASDEPLIGHYFVEPPFFSSVVGDPKHPRSNVIFAPRGGGKTAQKLMIEERSRQSVDFVCISYDHFFIDNLKSVKDADAGFHLKNISRALLIFLLCEMERTPEIIENVTTGQRDFLVKLSRESLGGLTADQFRIGLNSIKSWPHKATDIWNQYGGVISSLVNAIIGKFGYGAIDLQSSPSKIVEDGWKFKFEQLVGICQSVGYSSVYILVDRVDELPSTTQNADAAFAFVRSILLDLPLLETGGVAFKFFLWDQMSESYQEAGGRPDRITEYKLNWSVSQLELVLEKRLTTFSSGRVSRFDEILDGTQPYDLHRIIAYFAHGSPRDMIRICKRILDEHARSSAPAPKVAYRTAKSALQSFSLDRARELYGSHLSDIRKIGDLNFTISTLASDTFRVTTQAARSKVQKWQACGAVTKIGEVPNPGNRPHYKYGIIDPRLALGALSDASIEEFVDDYFMICPHCGWLRIAVDGEITCPDCQGNFKAEDAKKLAAVCSK